MKIGNRIPKEYFITSGIGESDLNNYPCSFDIALKKAGIENYNIIAYSSIMPEKAVKVEKHERYEHGAVIEIIKAESNGKKGETITAGLNIGWIYNKETNKKIGGMVAEYCGKGNEEEAKKKLNDSLKEMFDCRYDSERFELKDVHVIIKSFVPEKEYGTAIVAVCFTSYEYPVLDETFKD